MKKIALYLIVIVALFSACRKDDFMPRPNPAPKRSVLVYMIADNSLNSYAYTNIADMVAGAKKYAKEANTNYVVYLDPKTSDATTNGVGENLPRLINIAVDSKGNVRRDVVMWFPEQNSASPEVMQEVIRTFKKLYPSEVYGLMLWSHGTGWLPANYSFKKAVRSVRSIPGVTREITQPETKAFGQDGDYWMGIEELVAGIPDNTFEFIIFDACYMGGIEVLYPLRSKSNYIIASSAEILANGFPYDKIIPYIFGEKLDLLGLTKAYYDHYTDPAAYYKYATISLIKTSELESLRDINREIISSNRAAVPGINLSNVQKFNRFNFAGYYFLDMEDFISRIATPEQLQRFQAQMEKTVLFEDATNSMLELPIRTHSGLTMYVPQTLDLDLELFYSKLDWYQSVWVN